MDTLFAEIDKSLDRGKVEVDEEKARDGADWLAKIEEENAGELTPERIAAMEAAAAEEAGDGRDRRALPEAGEAREGRAGRGGVAHIGPTLLPYLGPGRLSTPSRRSPRPWPGRPRSRIRRRRPGPGRRGCSGRVTPSSPITFSVSGSSLHGARTKPPESVSSPLKNSRKASTSATSVVVRSAMRFRGLVEVLALHRLQGLADLGREPRRGGSARAPARSRCGGSR